MKTFIIIIVVHWIADFIYQDESWAIEKSKSMKALLKHTLLYSFIWYPFLFFATNKTIETFYFVGITFVAHTITDYFTSRIVSRKFANKEYGSPIPNFGAFTVIGFDQLLHYLQLIITWEILFN